MSRSKRALCLGEVLGLIDDDDDEPMMEGSEDKMDDLELDTRVEVDGSQSHKPLLIHLLCLQVLVHDVHVQEGSG